MLQRHIKIVHEGERHKCDLCDNTFVSKSGVYLHIRNVHKRDSKPFGKVNNGQLQRAI